MIQLIDQRNPNALRWRCARCGTEYEATRTRSELHECPEAVDEPERTVAVADDVPVKRKPGRPKKEAEPSEA